MYLTNYVFGEVKIDCRNEVSKTRSELFKMDNF